MSENGFKMICVSKLDTTSETSRITRINATSCVVDIKRKVSIEVEVSEDENER